MQNPTQTLPRHKRLEQSIRCREESSDALANGDAIAARELITRALEFNPHDDDAALLAAMMHFEANELEEAAKMAAIAVELRPFHPAGFNFLGVVCTDSGRSDLSQKLLEHAKQLAPGFQAVRANLKEAKRNGRERIGSGSIWKTLRARLQPSEPRCCACIVALPGEHDHVRATLQSVESICERVTLLCADIDEALLDLEGRSNVDVVHRPWNGDLAAAWNDAMESSRGEWLFLLRAGETLTDPADLIDCFEAGKPALYATVHVDLDGTTRAEPRLIRNAPGLRFRGRRRPEIRGSLLDARRAWGLHGASSAASIAGVGHWAPALDPDQRIAEVAWLGPWIERFPADFSLRLLRAHLRAETGDANGALADAERAHLDHKRSDPGFEPLFREETLLIEAQALAALENWDEMARRVGTYHRSWAPTADTAFLEALAAKAQGQAELATEWLEQAESLRARTRHAAPLAATAAGGLNALFGAVKLDRGDLDGAEQEFTKVLERDPEHLQAALGRAGIHLARGEWEACVQTVDEIGSRHPAHPEAWLFAGRLLARIPRLAEVAAHWFEEAVRRHPLDPALEKSRVDALIRCGRGDETPHDDSSPLGSRFAAALSCGQSLPDVPADQTQTVIDETLHWCTQWASVEAYSVLDRALTEIIKAEPHLPGLANATAEWLGRRGQFDAAEQLRQRLHPGVQA